MKNELVYADEPRTTCANGTESPQRTVLVNIEAIAGLAAQVERMAVEAAASAKRAGIGDQGRGLTAVVNEMRLLARTAVSVASEIRCDGGDSRHQSGRRGISQVMDLKGHAALLTPEESLLYERNMNKSAHVIAGIIGMPLTIRLVVNCGGNTVQPYGKDLSFLRDILGEEAIKKLKAWTGQDPIAVPLCGAARKAVIHSRIRAEFDRLTTVEKLSTLRAVRNLTYSTNPPMHERTIQRILKEADRDPTEKRAPGSRSNGTRCLERSLSERGSLSTKPKPEITELSVVENGIKRVIQLKDIAWMKADNGGVLLYTADEQIFLRGQNLRWLLPTLGPGFVRCNGSSCVQLSWIENVTGADKGGGKTEIVLRGGKRLRCSPQLRPPIVKHLSAVMSQVK